MIGQHNTNPIGPYTELMRELVEAALKWQDAREKDFVLLHLACVRMSAIAQKLPDNFSAHLEEELRKAGPC